MARNHFFNDMFRLVYDLFTDHLRIIYGLLTDYYECSRDVYDFIWVVLRWLYRLLRVIASTLRVATSTLRKYTYTLRHSYLLFTFLGKGIKAANLNTSFSVVIFWLKTVRTRKYS